VAAVPGHFVASEGDLKALVLTTYHGGFEQAIEKVRNRRSRAT
jgi:hypothetical protein